MSDTNVFEQLLFVDKAGRKRILQYAFQQYAQLLHDIYNDIYDSCIELYYSQYDPVKYDRHGYPEGRNLYSALETSINDLRIQLSLQGYRLSPYKGKGDKRDKVLDSVLSGLRGSKSRKSPPGWPMSWNAYYPNEFSEFSDWQSDGGTLDAIRRDFVKNGAKDLIDKFYEFIQMSI